MDYTGEQHEQKQKIKGAEKTRDLFCPGKKGEKHQLSIVPFNIVQHGDVEKDQGK